MTSENKTAIVVLGGGMRSAHGAGFLYALGEQFPSLRPDIIVASSGATGSALYFISGQYRPQKAVWTDILPRSRFISWIRFWRIMDIDYLVDDVFRKQFPLDTDALSRSCVQYFIPLLDTKTGLVRYIRREDGADPFAVFRASKSMPFFFDKATSLLGHSYIDGGVAVTLNDMVRCAREHGAKKILIIDDRTQLNTRKRIILLLYAYTIASSYARAAILQWIQGFNIPLETNGLICLLIRPKTAMFSATRNPKKVRALFDTGFDDALAHEAELRTLFA